MLFIYTLLLSNQEQNHVTEQFPRHLPELQACLQLCLTTSFLQGLREKPQETTGMIHYALLGLGVLLNLLMIIHTPIWTSVIFFFFL